MKTLYAWFSPSFAKWHGSLIYEDENGHDVEVTHVSSNKDEYGGIADKQFVGLVKEGRCRKSDRVPLSSFPAYTMLRLPEPKIPQPALYSGPTSRPQVTIPSGLFMPRPRRDGLARGWSNGYSFTPGQRTNQVSVL